MDTSTHFVTGISIAGLAHVDPIIASNPSLAHFVLIGTIIGAQAPDFDGISKFFGTASYIRHHRGINHSIPAILIWPTLITSGIYFFDNSLPFLHLWFWIFISVFFHVFLDVFNTYGTQALRPITEKWIALNIINIFDPFIFLLHSLGVLIWSVNWINTGRIFFFVYLFTGIYILWRWIAHKKQIQDTQSKYPSQVSLIMPTLYWNTWNIIVEQPKYFHLGVIKHGELNWVDKKIKKPEHSSIIASQSDSKVKSFLYFTNFAYPEYKETSFGYLVRWIDLRYRFKDHYPFNVIVILDHSLQVKNSYIGWIYNETFLIKKVNSLLAN